jgi:hypothetical protein
LCSSLPEKVKSDVIEFFIYIRQWFVHFYLEPDNDEMGYCVKPMQEQHHSNSSSRYGDTRRRASGWHVQMN